MGLLMTLVEKTVAKLKNDPSYHFVEEYTDRQIATLLTARGMQLLRGLLVRMRLSKSGGLIFAGRWIVLEHTYQIAAGPNLILEDHVHINALSENGICFGTNVTVGKGAIIVCTGVIANKGVGLEIGDYSAIGAQSFIGAQGGIRIGSDVIMGPGVKIFSENHNYDRREVPMRIQGEFRKKVVIEDDCWIGSGVTILGGVIVGTGTVIAAGAVVTKSIPPFSIVAGVPAKVLKNRG